MNRISRIAAFALLLVAVFSSFTASVASAHGHTTVGDYELVIGFRNEPAYQGEPNGLDLRVTNESTGEPVKGLEDTLKVELIRGDAKIELPLRAQWNQDGAYTADVIPTEDGAYTWRIFGTIETTPVDVSMTGGPDTFSEIESKSAVAFPAAEPTANELAQQIGQARTFGIVGSALGALGLIVGALSLLGRRSTQPLPARPEQRRA